MLGILINILIMLFILAVVLIFARKILANLGWGEFDGILVAGLLLVGLVWFLGIIGVISGIGPIVPIK